MNSTEVPPLEKKILAASLAFGASLLGLIAFSVYSLGVTVPTCVTVPVFDKAEVIAHPPGRYEVHALAEMWQFEPSRIKIPKGSIVDFYVTSADVTHGFYIEGTNVNLMVLPNIVNYAQARFDKPGKYNIMCHEYCGMNHQGMHAVLEVTE